MATIRVYVVDSWDGLKHWYKDNFTWRGALLLAVFLVKEIPDEFGRKDFWSTRLPAIWKMLYAHGTIVTVLLVGLFIWLDHRRVLAKRGKAHPRSLKGKCQRVGEAMQVFLDSLGPAPKPGESDIENETVIQGVIRRCDIRTQRWNKLEHQFELAFSDEVRCIFHEFGMRNIHDMELEEAIETHRKKEETYTLIIARLNSLAERPEAKTRV